MLGVDGEAVRLEIGASSLGIAKGEADSWGAELEVVDGCTSRRWGALTSNASFSDERPLRHSGSNRRGALPLSTGTLRVPAWGARDSSGNRGGASRPSCGAAGCRGAGAACRVAFRAAGERSGGAVASDLLGGRGPLRSSDCTAGSASAGMAIREGRHVGAEVVVDALEVGGVDSLAFTHQGAATPSATGSPSANTR